MQAMKRQFNKQAGTAGVVAIALIVVLLYSLWGASLLHNKNAPVGLSEAQAVATR